jgi:crossover junction endodeoxyribonuclease RuvC
MRVIAIDPGYDRCGIAIIEGPSGSEQVVFSECYQTEKKDSLNERIYSIGERVHKLIEQYQPDAMAVEDLFFAKNTKTALDVSQARGVIIFQGKRDKLKIYEYTPNQIKVAVTGYGSAKKNDIHFLVEKLVKLEDRKYIDDEIDAIAVGITCLASHTLEDKS